MSTTIDQRVVEMQFDNKHFEKNVQTSIDTVDKLNKSLDLKGASKGFENVDKAAKKVDFSVLTGAVETVSTKFSALQVMGVTALANITNSAVNAGKRIVSALTVDPIKTGLSEYETQMNAVQTILANTESKGSTLEDVNNALDELNTYADKTIYNFTEMTKNIGTFTAAGVDLDTSVNAIKGIANLAAVSGSTSQQASTAMYQLSQALSSGTVKLMDWNSVVNAGMGGQVFQDALKETARAHGIAIDDMIAKNGSFRETLREEWLTSEILLETLNKFTMTTEGLTDAQIEENRQMLLAKGYTNDQIDAIFKLGNTATNAATKVKTLTQLWDTLKETAQSGWTQSWEIVFGDFEEAKTLFSDLYNTLSPMIEATSAARNEMLKGWKDLGGRTALIDSVYNAFNGILSIIKPIKEAFREIFPPITSEQLYNFTVGLKELTAKLTLSDDVSAKLKSTFKGLFAVIDICRMAFVAVWDTIKPLVSGLFGVGDGILGVTASWGEWLVNLRNTIKENNTFYEALQKVVNFIKKALQKVVNFIKKAFTVIKKYVTIAIGAILIAVDKIKNAYEIVKEVLTPVMEKIKQFGKAIKEKFITPGFELFHALLERMNTRMEDVGETVGEMKSGIVVAFETIGEAIKNSGFLKFFGALWTVVKTVASGIAKAFGVLTEGLVDGLSNANYDTIFDLINALATGGVAVGITKFLDSVTKPLEGLQGILDGVTGILDGVRGCFEAYQTQLKADTLIKIAGAIAILTASLLVLSLIDSDAMNSAITAISTLFGELLLSMKIFTSMTKDSKGVVQASATMIAMSVAVLILATSLKTIANLDGDSLGRGLAGIAGLAAVVVAAAKMMSSDTKKTMKGAVSLVAFAAAIKILASVSADLSALSWEEMAKGLLGVGALLAEIALFLKLAKFDSKAVGTATGMVVLSAAIKILASACADFGAMEWGEIGKGLASIGASLAMLAIFTNLTSNAKHVISTGAALVLIGASMKIFASAISDFAYMSWEELGKGLTAFAGALAAVTIAVNLMPKNMVGKGVGLIAVATAMAILNTALTDMGGMSWESIGKSMVTLGRSLALLAAGLHAMNGTLSGSAALLVASAAILILTPALSILGAMSWTGILKGLVALAGAFTVLGIAGLVLGPIVPSILGLSGSVALLGVGILAAALGVQAFAIALGSLAAVGTAGAAAIVAALTVIIVGVAGMIPTVITKVGEGIIALLQVIIDATPTIVEAVIVIVLAVLEALVTLVPPLVETIFVLLAAVLQALVDYTPTLIQAVCDILIACLAGIANNLDDVVAVAIDVVLAFIAGVARKIPDVIQSGFDLLISFITGMADAIEKNAEPLIEAVDQLMDAVINAIVLWFTTFSSKGIEIVDKIIEGIKKSFESIKQAGKDMIGGFIEGVTSKAKDIVDAATGVISGAVDSIKDFLGIHSPSRLFRQIGIYSDEGLIAGLKSLSGKVASSAEGVGEGAAEAMTNALATVSDIINNDMDSTPVIRPVLDLSNIESGTKSIDATFGRYHAMVLGAKMNGTTQTVNEAGDSNNPQNGTVYQFTQNNYSPRALSRLDIYRQTMNQFSALKEVLQK